MAELKVKNGQIRGFRNYVTSGTTELLKQNPEQRFTAREIAAHLIEQNPELGTFMFETSEVVNDDTKVLNRLVARISQFRDHMKGVKTTEERPRKFYYTEKTDEAEVAEAESEGVSTSPAITETPKLSEHELYPLLSTYLSSELGLYSKRIDEKRSHNSRGPNGNRWLYPDVVALEDLSAEWHREIKDCVQQYSDKKTKLWSFEVKIFINRSNVREAFFQAVSNSSWANFAYLVARNITEDAYKELRILSSLHGIGFIRLDTEESTSESQIMIPAQERINVDWNTANRLAEENSDFLDYIKLVRQFYQTGDVRASEWDGETN